MEFIKFYIHYRDLYLVHCNDTVYNYTRNLAEKRWATILTFFSKRLMTS